MKNSYLSIYLFIFIIFSFYVDAHEFHSFSEFRRNLQSLNIIDRKEYLKFFINEGKDLGFPSLNQIPEIYSKEWKGWADLFENVSNDIQNSTHTSSKHSTKNFMTYRSFISLMETEGIDNYDDYQIWYKENRDIFNVPLHPEKMYSQFKDWSVLGDSPPVSKPITRPKNRINKNDSNNHKERRQYLPYEELKKKAQVLGIKSSLEYRKRYKEIPGAPLHPDRIYREEWEGWRIFFGTSLQQYLPYEELKEKAQVLGIKSSFEYRKRYKEIPGAPSNPDHTYGKEWEGWGIFLGISLQQRQRQYLPYEELKKKVQVLGIKSFLEYRKRYKEIPGAPSNPNIIYREEWEGWRIFFGTSLQQYLPYEELKEKVQVLGITSIEEYRKRYKEIPGAPSNPNIIYREEWEGWRAFLGTNLQQRQRQYLPYEELKEKVQVLGIISVKEYRKRYKEIPGTPLHPNRTYREEWEGWRAFLGTNLQQRQQQYLSYEELKKKVQALGIKSSLEYRERYKEIPGAPSNPKSYIQRRMGGVGGLYWGQIFSNIFLMKN